MGLGLPRITPLREPFRLLANKLRLAVGPDLTLANLWDGLAETYGEAACLRLPPGGDPLSFREFRDRVARLAGALGRNIRPGDRVALWTANTADSLIALFAILRRGAVAVELNPLLAPDEVRYIVGDASAKVLVVDSSTRRKVRGLGRALLLDELLDTRAKPAPPASTEADDVALVLYTSGTTGRPKGARLTSAGLLASLRGALLYPNLQTNRPEPPRSAGETGLGSGRLNDLMVHALPVSHVMGLSTLLMAHLAGVPVLFLGKFEAGRVLETIERFKATMFVGVPAMYALLLEAGAEERDLRSVRLWVSAADAMPPAHVARFLEMGARRTLAGRERPDCLFTEAYGMVELSGAAFVKVNLPGVALEPGCIGLPIPPYRAKVVDERGRRVLPGRVGELAVKGPGILKGYVGGEASILPGGWLRTGDYARLGRFGLFYFAGRKKDVIKCGGYPIYAVEVEGNLLEHPAVAEAAVFGVPHPTKGEAPVAAVVRRPGKRATEARLQAWSRKRMAAYKVPRRILFVDALPVGATKKVQKRELKVRYAGLFVNSNR